MSLDDPTLCLGKGPAPSHLAAGPGPLLERGAHLAEELSRSWRAGQHRSAEALLAEAHEPLAGPHAVFAVVAEEVQLRRELGPPPSLEEFQARFPALATPLLDLFAASAPAPRLPACGEMLAECLLLAELGGGATGRAFLATQPLLA